MPLLPVGGTGTFFRWAGQRAPSAGREEACTAQGRGAAKRPALLPPAHVSSSAGAGGPPPHAGKLAEAGIEIKGRKMQRHAIHKYLFLSEMRILARTFTSWLSAGL